MATNLILGEVNSIEDLTFAIMIGAGAGLLGETSARLLTKGITKYFGGLTKAKQKAFLNSIGNISNRDLNAIRKIISKGLTPEILNDLVDKYGYAILASAFVSSIGTSIDWEGVIS